MRANTNFCKEFFIEVFKCKSFGYKEGRGEELQGKLFYFSIMPMGGMQIHWFKLVTSYRRREQKNVDLWLLGPTAFFTSVECRPLHGKGHLLDEIILSLPNRV